MEVFACRMSRWKNLCNGWNRQLRARARRNRSRCWKRALRASSNLLSIGQEDSYVANVISGRSGDDSVAESLKERLRFECCEGCIGAIHLRYSCERLAIDNCASGGSVPIYPICACAENRH